MEWSHLLKKPAKHLCNVCFWVTLAMSVSFSFQISDSRFLLNGVEKVKGGRDVCEDDKVVNKEHQSYDDCPST